MSEELKLGSEVWLKLPYGDLFTQPHNKTNTVFIAGGTGITPFLSLFTHESFKNYKNPKIYLGFKSLVYNIYDNELKLIRNIDPKIFYEDIDGMLNIDQIFNENGISSDYYISGPPIMIKSFKRLLLLNGVPDSQIFTDDWL
jgi:ferredoxin-NADP reductase